MQHGRFMVTGPQCAVRPLSLPPPLSSPSPQVLGYADVTPGMPLKASVLSVDEPQGLLVQVGVQPVQVTSPGSLPGCTACCTACQH
jgi:hypothetical protein